MQATDTEGAEGRTATPDNSEASDRSWHLAQTWRRLVMKSFAGALLSDGDDITFP